MSVSVWLLPRSERTTTDKLKYISCCTEYGRQPKIHREALGNIYEINDY